ncbi:MAG: hypothetical protein WC829_01465 [Hyphomicrobium sp.]|jgi:hypothetical protein
MHFLAQIEHHLSNFETDSREEIARFIEYLKSKFVEPGAPVPSAVALAPEAPVAADLVKPVEAPPAPVVAPDPVVPVVAPKVDTGAVV